MIYRRYLLIVAIATCLAIGMAWAVHRPEAGGGGFSAMTFNVGDANPRPFPVARTAACILDEGRPDILFLQEVPGGRARAELLEALGYPHAAGAQAKSGKLAGLMVLSLYPIGETREIELPSDGRGSGALCAVLDIDGERVLACSVHLDEVDPKVRNAEGQVVFSARQALDSIYAELFSDTVRTAAVKVLGAAVAHAGMPVILAGDFNTVPVSRTIRHVSARYRDVLWPGVGWFQGTYHKIAFPLNPRIDYIFVSQRIAVDQARVLARSAGDHFPVRAALKKSA
ncbi:endonuclease/exonuclease/phosphatase family protein [Desulfoglaeba alkanexedens]|uniref:Endonuclease/exonuclease/phosphatase domain-containing protein n=1 Tax=Desulfoglaeba alkanexedens ALDC TaxID=980445 RepID=A0A4P8KZF2_9BACT|nr:endonuclease/exonuclease/phosphatase family protein [Desulfoglaeba alkanexedens]QCQ20838.1 hypothetical protein FDQ92_00655 [Desulfoglaeba alkanexedens ALDC]